MVEEDEHATKGARTETQTKQNKLKQNLSRRERGCICVCMHVCKREGHGVSHGDGRVVVI